VQVYGSRDGQQSFAALGRVKPEEPYQGQMGPGFTPFRRDVARGPARMAPIAPLRRRLVLTAGKTNRGAPFRFGLVQVQDADRAVIAAAMGCGMQVSTEPGLTCAFCDTICRSGQSPTRGDRPLQLPQDRASIRRLKWGGAMRYSGLKVITEGLFGNKGWRPAWRDPAPKAEYDAIIIGGGGHGLATAFYLAKNHGLTNIAVLEKGYLGSGNIGRNTTIVRANYFLPGNSEFYSHSMKLWEGMEAELNYNVMHSQRGLINLFHSDGQRDAFVRRGNAMINQGDDAILLDREGVREHLPYLDFEQTRFPIYGGLLHPRGGSARHDAVAWGYARGADRRGVDLIQNCEVTGIDIENGVVRGVQTTRGAIRARKVGIIVAGRSGQVAAMAGMRLPIESHILQAFVSEGLKPVINHVISFGMGHFYISQSDKGGLVFGGDLDFYASYASRGNLPMVEHVMEAGMTLMPMIGRARVLRSWGGIMDMTPDGSPIIDKTPVDGLFIDCGWNYGGFKAVPASGWCMAHLMATGQPHEVARRFRLDRFATGHLLDEEGTGSQHNLH
jgi:sarcosine oxidase subunit beta